MPRVKWLGLPRCVDGSVRLEGESFEADATEVAPHLLDGSCVAVDAVGRVLEFDEGGHVKPAEPEPAPAPSGRRATSSREE
jgi:hypothetical protein